MNWGVQYKPVGGPFKGMRIALMEDYGLPLLFRDCMKAREYARRQVLHQGNSVPEMVARRLVKNIVEYFSGRLIIVREGNTAKFVLNPGKPNHRLQDKFSTYEELEKYFTKKGGANKKVPLRLRQT